MPLRDHLRVVNWSPRALPPLSRPPVMNAPSPLAAEPAAEREHVILRFAGDSGDGMQVTGSRFTEASALFGNDVATLPDFPAEIRAPAGTLPGVSGFQLQFASHDVYTAGDSPDVLVAMNPAALAKNLPDLEPGATIVVDADAFHERALAKAGLNTNPLDDGSLGAFRVHTVPITTLTVEALSDAEGLSHRDKERCRNFFALGLASWMFSRPLDSTRAWIDRKFGPGSALALANRQVLQKGWDFGLTTEAFAHPVHVRPARLTPGTYRNITGNQALALGLTAASYLAGRQLFLGSYPITPASDILHELARYEAFGVHTFQAEDEIAAVCSAIGAAYGGAIGVTTSSGPGISLKGEAIGLAIMTELPLIVVDVQRGGPSTGLPTKTEQADLFQALYGRHGESPLLVLAPSSPSDCFHIAIEAVRLSLTSMTPVLLLSDGYIANGAEPWKVPDLDALEPITLAPVGPAEDFQPYQRDPETLARPWVTPGMAGYEHRIGGLEKADGTGHISYAPANHEKMVHLRQEKVERVARRLPPLTVEGDEDARTLVVGWGGTEGSLRTACAELRRRGEKVARAHLRHLAPLPANTEEVLRRYERVIVAELNLGQLAQVLRARFALPIRSLTKVQGQPFRTAELVQGLLEHLEPA